MARGLVVVAVVTLLAAAVVPAGTATAAGGFGQEQVDPDRVVLGVDLQPDGNAVWTVEYRVRLATDNETAAFEDIQTDIRENSSRYTSAFASRMARTAATAENATGREMAIENVTVRAEQTALPQEYGVITYRFEWTNFAAVDGETVRAGDTLAGFFLDNATSLRMSWPDGYVATDVRPAADQTGDSEVVWRGPREFGANEPTLVIEPSSDATGPSGGSLGSIWVLAVAVVVAGVLLGTAFMARRRGALDGPLNSGEKARQGSDETTAEDSGDDGPPPELLSNEERVLTLLESNDGRLKQQQVAERLDWTAAKTSQVIGDMREDETIETFRLGRENVVTLPDRGLGDDLGPGESDT